MEKYTHQLTREGFIAEENPRKTITMVFATLMLLAAPVHGGNPYGSWCIGDANLDGEAVVAELVSGIRAALDR